MTIKIGIVAQNHEGNDRAKFGVNQEYLEFISNFGSPIIICPVSKEEFNDFYRIDALLLPGGSDVDYKRYAKYPPFLNYAPNPFLEYFDSEVLPTLISNIPIFGICRGLQTLNVFFGGTLRNLYYHPHSDFNGDMAHEVEIPKANNKVLKTKVNSYHHQGIDKLAKNFTVEAKFPTLNASWGVIEAISDYSKKIFAVQWHPERSQDDFSIKAFREILK